MIGNLKQVIFRGFFSVFPACAGVILLHADFLISRDGFPRVCGGDPGFIVAATLEKLFSPRVRG